MEKKENKTELIHIRIEPEVKEQVEGILKNLGINTSYAVSMFLKQVILNGGLPFNVELPKDQSICEVTYDETTERVKKIIELYADKTLDYESAMVAIKKIIEE